MREHCKQYFSVSTMLFLLLMLFPAHADYPADGPVSIDVAVTVSPIAEIELPDGADLSVTIPPPDSTIPSGGLRLLVRGNAMAEVTATPDAWLYVGPQGRYYGKAVKGQDVTGYDLIVEFPMNTYNGGLTGNDGEGTIPRAVDVTDGPVEGMLHLLADHNWTADGSWPAPGTYTGTVTLTVTAHM